MHELKQVYQKYTRIAFLFAFMLHLGFVGIVWKWSVLLWPEERSIPIRLLPYTELVRVKPLSPESEEPGGGAPALPPPVKPPPKETPPPETTMREIVPVPDWMVVDSLMADVSFEGEHPIQDAVTVAHVGVGGGRGGGGSGGQGTGSSEGSAGASGPIDEMPRLLKKVEPEYPRIARLTGVEGVVVLSLLVNESGHVTDTQVLKSLGNTGCDEAAVTAARQWRFAPATKGGRSVAMWIRVPILFQLKMGR